MSIFSLAADSVRSGVPSITHTLRRGWPSGRRSVRSTSFITVFTDPSTSTSSR
jgi:hypothetical protein